MKAFKGKSAKAATPISSHPLFPAIVALWFAALFGFGSLVLPTILIERAVDAVGLPSLIGATAPPLGFTAKLLIAAIAALFGAAVGFFIARKVAGANKPEKQRQRGLQGESQKKAAKRPISATEELGSETLDAPVQQDSGAGAQDQNARRRGLAVSEDETAPSEFLQQAPVPGTLGQAQEYGQEPTAAYSGSYDDDAGEEVLSFAQPSAQDAPAPMAQSQFAEPQASYENDELRFQPTPDVQPTERQFESKQVFQPQAPEPIQSVAPSTAPHPEEEFATQSHQTPAAMHEYQDDVQRGMPRLKVEPDPEPSAQPAEEFGFQPLDKPYGPSPQQQPPVSPELEARLSGLTHEDDTELPPTSVLDTTLRAPKEAPEQNPVPTEASEAAPLSFSPPSLGKKKPVEEPLELETADEVEAEQIEPQEFAPAQVPEAFTPPPAQTFAMPQGFEDAQPLGAEPLELGGYSAENLKDESSNDETAELDHLAALHNELNAAVEKFGAENEIAETQETVEQEFAANQPDIEFAESDADADVDELDEELPIMTDPVSGQPLDTLGTVELIERLAKSVRLRATSGVGQQAIAATAPAHMQAEVAETVEAPTQVAASDTDVEAEAERAFAQPATDEVAGEDDQSAPSAAPAPFAPPAENFAQPQSFAPPVAQSSTEQPHGSKADFVPSALKPIDLNLEDELDEDADSFSLPLGKPAPTPSVGAPFAAPAQPQEVTEVPPAPQVSPFAEPTEDVPQASFDPEPAQPSAPTDEQPFSNSEQSDHHEEEAEEPFGSLLELRNRLTQPREFVRVDDEETASQSAGPAVVFPGQEGSSAVPSQVPEVAPTVAPQAFAEPAQPVAEPASSHEMPAQQPAQPVSAPSFTRRDASPQGSATSEAAPAAQPAAAPAGDPAETERALRTALATLQRMSGAA